MVLVTGFEPFTTGQGLTLEHNPTADICRQVAANIDGAQHRVLPVSFQRTKKALLDALQHQKPKIWVGLRYAPHRTTLDFEAVIKPAASAASPGIAMLAANLIKALYLGDLGRLYYRNVGPRTSR